MDKVPRVGIGVFVIKNKKFLMGQRKGSHGEGSWATPGGHLDFGESVETGAAREVMEETGVKIRNPRIIGVTNDIFKKEDKHYITIWVVSKWKSGKEKIMEPEKCLEIGWFNFKTLPKPLFLSWKQLLKSDFLNEIKKEVLKS